MVMMMPLYYNTPTSNNDTVFRATPPTKPLPMNDPTSIEPSPLQEEVEEAHSSAPLRRSRIAFGSCNDQSQYNALWPRVSARNPAAFIWGGDAIYADRPGPLDWSVFPPVPTHQCADPTRLRRLYRQQQLHVPGYKALWQANVTIFGTFDDHDYGCNNADRTYAYKYESGRAMVDFLQLAPASPMYQRAQQGHGVYGVQLLDFARSRGLEAIPDVDAGIDADVPVPASSSSHSYSNRTVAIFVLDVRTHKTPWRKDWPGRYQLDPHGDFLGERQWQWLAASLQRSRAALHVIVTGLQVHAYRFPDGNVAESWAQYPTAQQRLFDLLLSNKEHSAAPLLISGDVHMAQLLRKDCMRRTNQKEGTWQESPQRSLMELTTSGMTHSWGTLSKPLHHPELYHPTWWQQYQSLAAKTMIRLLHFLCPWTDIMDATGLEHSENGGGEHATVPGLQYSLEQNFGEVEIDWETETVQIRAFGTGGDDQPPLLMAQVHLDQLRGNQPMSSQLLTTADYRAEWARNPGGRYSKYANDSHVWNDEASWVCVNHRGRDTALQHAIGHVSSAVILTILVPLPLVAPLTLVSLLALLVLRRWAARWRPSRRARVHISSTKRWTSVRTQWEWMAWAVLGPKNYWFSLTKQR